MEKRAEKKQKLNKYRIYIGTLQPNYSEILYIGLAKLVDLVDLTYSFIPQNLDFLNS